MNISIAPFETIGIRGLEYLGAIEDIHAEISGVITGVDAENGILMSPDFNQTEKIVIHLMNNKDSFEWNEVLEDGAYRLLQSAEVWAFIDNALRLNTIGMVW